MKKIMAVIVALMFVSTMTFSGLAFAGGPKEKGKAPMSDKAKDGAKVSEDAKAKVSEDAKAKGKGEGHEAKMGKMDMMDKKGKMGKMDMMDMMDKKGKMGKMDMMDKMDKR